MAKGEWDRARTGPRTRPNDRIVTPEDIGDPAKGEKVSRCAVCGMPSTDVMRGSWNGLWGTLIVCQRDWFARNPPDPLDVRVA